ncbi:hypothetical protein [Rubricoccus marinus]|uniref:hypothetical protein n=1 Tax=Rubricoccus marinus TaxID=716817 RepID=UPI00117B75A3|nr:hypothetical protein [Rubricoccus marinus]
MERHLVPLGSDAVNRYRIRVTAGAHAGSMWTAWEEGLPRLVSHDHERLEGWGRPYALCFDPGLTSAYGVAELAETEEERDALRERLAALFAERVERECRPHEAELRRALPVAGETAELFYAGAACLLRPGLVREALPGLYGTEDGDGLIELAGLVPLGGGAFQSGDLVVFGHPMFRRSFSRYNTLNGAFFDTLREAVEAGVVVRVALDPDLVGLAATYRQPYEFQYWFGPPFTDDLSSIEAGPVRHGSDERHHLFSQVIHTDFHWYERNGAFTLEVEEVRDWPSAALGDRYGCRYVHSIVDGETGTVEHLDGAVRVYDETQMVERLDLHLNRATRQTDYTKLWRTDDPLPLAMWKRLVHDYYRDNYLVGEYLAGSDGSERAALVGVPTAPPGPTSQANDGAGVLPALREASTVEHLRDRLASPTLRSGSGVRACLSFHPRSQDPTPERWFRPFTFLPSPEPYAPAPLLELGTLDLKKILDHSGGEVVLPPSTQYVHYRDGIVNLCPLVHGTEDAGLVEETLAGLQAYAASCLGSGPTTALTLTVAYPVENRVVRVSAAGSAADLVAWLDAVPALPRSRAEAAEWSGEVASHYAGQGHAPPTVLDLLTPSGLFLERTPIPAALSPRPRYDEEAERWAASFTRPSGVYADAGWSVLAEALETGALGVTLAWLIDGIECHGCGGDYGTCPCTVLDSGFGRALTPRELFSLSWSGDV